MGITRVRGTVFTVPVIHGNVSHYLGDQCSEARTHKWTVYLRPAQNAVISHFIKHVEFQLHNSFSPQTRKLYDMPYEVNEFGWGEFDIIIRIYFHDTNEKHVEIIHPLSLFKSDGTPSSEPVVSEFYDELVFTDPSEKMLNLLQSTPHGPHVKLPHSICAPHYTDFTNTESATLRSIGHARNRLREETNKKKERYEKLEEERASLIRELNQRGINT